MLNFEIKNKIEDFPKIIDIFILSHIHTFTYTKVPEYSSLSDW